MRNRSKSKKRSSKKRKNSIEKVKYTWDKMLKNKESKEILKKSWTNKDLINNNDIKKLHRKYSNELTLTTKK